MLRYSKSKPSHFVSCNVELLVFLISSGNWLTFMIIKIDERIALLTLLINGGGGGSDWIQFSCSAHASLGSVRSQNSRRPDQISLVLKNQLGHSKWG